MAGHSKWANIKHKKASSDAKKQKIFQKINKEIISAIKQGGSNLETNFSLRAIIEKAKAANMPKDNIQKTLNRALKEKDSLNLKELTYEGYGPGGVAIMVECLSDNINRTSANIKSYFNKRGGNLGSTGSVSYIFKIKGILIFESKIEEEKIFELLVNENVIDIEYENNIYVVETEKDLFLKTKNILENFGVNNFIQSEITKIPNITIELEDELKHLKLEHMLDLIEDDDDVINVYHNSK